MVYEKPQKGNPNRISVKQHVFPKRCISRFVNKDGFVHLHLKEQKKTISVKPDNQIFCARRRWNQIAEHGFMKEVENDYNRIVGQSILGVERKLTDSDHKCISLMYALWCVRERARRDPIEDQHVNGIQGVTKHYNKHDREMLETKGISVIDPMLNIPGREIESIKIRLDVDQIVERIHSVQWGIIQSVNGEFIAPDCFNGSLIIPVAPDRCLMADNDDCMIDRDAVRNLNKVSIERSSEYYYARYLERCPMPNEYDEGFE